MNFRISSNHLVLLFILLTGTLLRVWHLMEIPLTHDEFSVIFRTGYDSFAELIEQGVMVDVHPAGIQVFMNYWIELFGQSAVAVKIPFIIFGFFTILLVYELGEEWFNPSVGLITATFIACLEYTVMYSQIARPYMSGLFFSLLMVYGWQRYLFSPGKSSIAWLILYVIASAICAYNHYFSLLFAAIVGVTGLFFITWRRFISYSVAGVAIFGLYIPHLSIFFHQFQEKGVEGWLGKPDNDFIVDYIGYIFHFSPLVYAMVAIIIVAGIRLQKGPGLLKSKFFYISLAWFSLPILIGFFYSRYVNAVLQYSGLIFTFPFFLFLVFGNLPDFKKSVKYLAVPLISLVLILTLIYGRQYYSLFYQSRFKHLILDTEQTISEYGADNCLVIMDSHKKISDYYYEALDIRFDHFHYDDFTDRNAFIDLIKNTEKDYLSLAVDSHTDLALPGIIMQYFPSMMLKKDYFGGNYYLFSRTEGKEGSILFTSRNGFSGEGPGWSRITDSLLIDSAGIDDSPAYLMSGGQEFSPTFSYPLGDLVNQRTDMIDVSVNIRNRDSLNQSLLVLQVKGKRGLLKWTASHFRDYDRGKGDWYTVHHTFRTAQNPRRKNLQVNVYIWNRDKTNFLCNNFIVRSRKGNPVLYGLLEKF
ncbi:MAG: hypothetical protein AMS23_09125 [Bacteroides sp. SM1_62]|nr:MAG: hypothetical protein AMS23_09125 [Bacteroides sp. SM1_62]